MSQLFDKNIVGKQTVSGRGSVGAIDKPKKIKTQLQIEADAMIDYLTNWKNSLLEIKNGGTI